MTANGPRAQRNQRASLRSAQPATPKGLISARRLAGRANDPVLLDIESLRSSVQRLEEVVPHRRRQCGRDNRWRGTGKRLEVEDVPDDGHADQLGGDELETER